MKKIKLDSRDYMNNYLLEVEKNKFKLVTELDCIRVIMDSEHNNIKSIDPPGGPMITVGTDIQGKIVRAIYFSPKDKGFIIDFSE